MDTTQIAKTMDTAIVKLKRLLVKPTYEQLINKHAKSIKLLEMMAECDDRIERQKEWLNENRKSSLIGHKTKLKERLDTTKEMKKRIEKSYIKLQTS